ncbi:MAG: leucine-rich repeat domain-containing protein [Cyclobacteriaceae bacterium]|nr:leucine-rich repeat domain-containing protein [Cyclobacteriaceae bacterium]MCH8514806.1 leucine-rich repeat domain-containing protein [Cyclobacteriaceae bacterium]
MTKSRLKIYWLAAIFSVFTFTTACSDDDEDPIPEEEETELPEEQEDESDEDEEEGFVVFEDPSLKEAVLLALEKAAGPISEEEMEALLELNIDDKGIESLVGLEKAINLEKLEMRANTVVSMDPIAALEKLVYLDMRSAVVPDADLSFVSELNLIYLDLRETGISNIAPLSNLTNLEELFLRENNVADLSPLANLTSLFYLNIHSNVNITDVSSLANLTNLETLIMRDVPAGDALWEVVTNFDKLVRANFRNTGITDLTVLGDMMSRGILQDNPAAGIEAELDIRNNDFGEVTADNDPWAPVREFWPNIADAAPQDLPPAPEPGNTFDDANLEAAIRTILDIDADEDITNAMLESITEIEARDADIVLLGGIEKCINLEVLDLRDNPVSDISKIAELTKLTFVNFRETEVADISALQNLNDLEYVNLNRAGGVTDVTSLIGKNKLYYLNLRDASLSDAQFSAVYEDLVLLEETNLRGTGITDISILADIMSKGALRTANRLSETSLDLRGNNITNCEVIEDFVCDVDDLDSGNCSFDC